jgi:hypothetical protein
VTVSRVSMRSLMPFHACATGPISFTASGWPDSSSVTAQGHGKVVKWGVSCGFVAAGDVSGVPADGGQGPGGTMEVPTLTSPASRDPPADAILAYPGCPLPLPA